MKEKEIIEGSKIIGVFDGWQRKDAPKHSELNWFHPKYSTVILAGIAIFNSPKSFKYHLEYNWLMPVYCKFRDLKLDLLQKHYHKQIMAPVKYALAHGTIEQLFIELVAAVKWYNHYIKIITHP